MSLISDLACLAKTHRDIARSWFELGGNVAEALIHDPSLGDLSDSNKKLARQAYEFRLKFDSMEEAVAAVPFPKMLGDRLDPLYIEKIGNLFGKKKAAIAAMFRLERL